MSKMTIATDEQGNILGAIQHAAEQGSRDGPKVAVSFAPGTRLHVVDVGPEIDMTKVSDVPKFHEALSRHAAKAK
jgi:hypothetical protein